MFVLYNGMVFNLDHVDQMGAVLNYGDPVIMMERVRSDGRLNDFMTMRFSTMENAENAMRKIIRGIHRGERIIQVKDGD